LQFTQYNVAGDR